MTTHCLSEKGWGRWNGFQQGRRGRREGLKLHNVHDYIIRVRIPSSETSNYVRCMASKRKLSKNYEKVIKLAINECRILKDNFHLSIICKAIGTPNVNYNPYLNIFTVYSGGWVCGGSLLPHSYLSRFNISSKWNKNYLYLSLNYYVLISDRN